MKFIITTACIISILSIFQVSGKEKNGRQVYWGWNTYPQQWPPWNNYMLQQPQWQGPPFIYYNNPYNYNEEVNTHKVEIDSSNEWEQTQDNFPLQSWMRESPRKLGNCSCNCAVSSCMYPKNAKECSICVRDAADLGTGYYGYQFKNPVPSSDTKQKPQCKIKTKYPRDSTQCVVDCVKFFYGCEGFFGAKHLKDNSCYCVWDPP